MPPRVVFRPCHPAEPPASELLEAMVKELRELYGLAGGRLGVPLELDELAPPGGRYLVGWDGSGRHGAVTAGPAEPVAGGGLRTIDVGVGEIKRMYVAPAWRGRGVARLLLSALEEEGRRLGLQQVRLDTGARQPHAQRLYESAGYRPVPNYNGNAHAAFWGEKQL